MTIDPVADEIAETIYSAFVDYHGNFHSLTRRSAGHFDRREWMLAQVDANERLGLHRDIVELAVRRTNETLESLDSAARKEMWQQARWIYAEMIDGRSDVELAETFFNSVTRRVFTTIGVDNDLEFRWFGPTALPRGEGRALVYRTYSPDGGVQEWIQRILEDYDATMDTTFVDLEADAKRTAEVVEEYLLDKFHTTAVSGIDCVVPLFFRNKGAYIVGRIRHLNRICPFVVPLLHTTKGVVVDTVLLTESHASRVFGVTRSYLEVEWAHPAEVVGFIKSFLPMKAISELYTAIGYSQHGKTSLYRSLYRHMRNSTSKFEIARGTPGMVMLVFTLESFNVVFKVIRDRFDQPKKCTPEQVMGKYRLVFSHDRVGRMVDAQEFEQLSFHRDRFSDELLEQLVELTAERVTVTDREVVLHHAYTERQLYPLNLYLREMDLERAKAAAIDYGHAIKDLAAANIFPGDLFTKNFGVTRHGDVVFYDYDELTLLENCRFRSIPDSDRYEDEMAADPWFPVGPDDVFPEQFRTFIHFDEPVREAFLEMHSDLFDVEFWTSLQRQHARGDIPDFYPYDQDLRFL
ncbi:MAG: bifunctional isocitrate dehydrogenase kinase/phosphatase [Acidobacteria bacterium]|nr:bifunctional isocitrate dehydrogenase kinase/phosphatase [Acidobacteriota bacterium]